MTGAIAERSGSAGPTPFGGATFEWSSSVDRAAKDLTMHSVFFEGSWRPARPWLAPVELGVSLGLHDTTGTIMRSGSDTAPLARDDSSTRGVSLGGFVRYHALDFGRGTVFLEAAVQAAYFERAFPAGGTRFDGLPRFGTGLELRAGRDLTLIAGAHWTHVSNGQDDNNPGFDGLGGFVGLRYRFGSPGDEGKPRVQRKLPEKPENDGRVWGALNAAYHPGHLDEATGLALHSVEGEYEWRHPWAPWCGWVGALSVHRATGSLRDPGHGLGLMNPGSTGFGWHVGARPSLPLYGNVALYAEARLGGVRFNRSWPFTAGAGRFIEPWKWARSVDLGIGIQWRCSENRHLVLGYRHLDMDTSDERPGDARDFRSGGFVLGTRSLF